MAETIEDRIARAERETQARLEQPSRPRGVFTALGAAGLVVLKFFKPLLFALQFLKFGKVLLTASTMGVMIWTYSLQHGWPFAAGFVFLILVHELGHGWAARQMGLEVGAPVFIPFLGAFIALKDKPKSAYQDFFIGAGGPIAGTAGGLLCFALAPHAGEWGTMLVRLGYFTLVMNLFNLMPVGFLDGSRMVAPLGKREWAIGLPLMVLAAYASLHEHDHFNPIALLVIALAVLRGGAKIFRRPRPGATIEIQAEGSAACVTDAQRTIAACTYFGLASLLIAVVHLSWSGLDG
jgi:Zn-dependent protease